MTLGAKIGLACALAAALAALAIWIASRMRATPEKRERLRRLSIHTSGRLGDAFLTEVRENLLHYTYKVRGVQYEASQDVSTLRDRLPADPERMIGMVGMKYLSKNPANSILVCEEWSGLREPFRRTDPASLVSADGDAIGHQP
ncbi:MAG: hypothetical protein M3N41_07850 [Acidobacteriota bacterium]|nr:hypothetical protein [Acidobacteriota bacterium]